MAKKHDVVIITKKIDRSGKGEENHTFYIYTDKDIKNILSLNVTKKSLGDNNLTDKEELVYSSNDDINPDYHIDFINNKLDVTIYPLSYLKEDTMQKYRPITAFSAYTDNINSFNNDILKEFDFASPDINKMSNDSFDYDLAFRNQIEIFFILGAILIILFMVFNVSDSMNKIAIKKMHGFSNGEIAFSLFYPMMLYVVITQMISTIILFILYINTFNKTTINFLKEYLQAIGTIDILFIVILIFLYLIVSIIKLPKLIKNYNFNNTLLNITFFAKVVFLIFLIPMLLDGLTSFTDFFPQYIDLKKVEDSYKEIYLIGSDREDIRFDGYDIEKYVTGETDQVYDKHVKNYNSLLEVDHLVFQRQTSVIPSKFLDRDIDDISEKTYGGFIIDKGYIEKHQILGKDNKDLKLDLSGNIVYILIPQSIYNDKNLLEDDFYTDENPKELMAINDKQEFMDYALPIYGKVEMQDHQKTPFFMVYSNNSFRYDKSLMIDSYLIGFKNIKEAHEELKKVNSKKIYNLKSAEKLIKESKKDFQLYFIESSISLLPVTGVIIAMNISILGLYYRSKRKKLSIFKINGYSSLRANRDLIIGLFISFIVPTTILSMISSENIFIASIYVFLIDIVCSATIFIYYQKMNVVLQAID